MEKTGDKKGVTSVLVAVYNGEKHIKETLESLLNQENAEIIVVDDGSTDNTAEIIKSVKDNRIRYFYQKNSGSPAAPRNRGIKEAIGEFIGLCDQDDVWYKDKATKQIVAYEKSENKNQIGIIVSSANIIDENGRISSLTKKPFSGFMSSNKANELLLNGDFITACSALVPKKVFEEIGPLDESLKGVDDYDLWLRITEKYGILTIKEPLCAWRQTRKSLSSDKVKQYIETEKVFKKLEDKTAEIKVGHGKNLTRIFLGQVLNKDFPSALSTSNQMTEYPLSGKINLILSVYKVNKYLGYFLIKLLKVIGRVSL